jgi:RNase H-fold protein (predicted Holliday junction resolvase)
MEDLSAALESTFAARLERRETLNEVLTEEAEKCCRATTSLYETKVADKRRTGRMMRRSGIVDGGLMISISLASI